MNNKVVLSVIGFAFFIVIASGSGDDRTPEQKAKDNCEDTTMAFIMSQNFVKKHLKSPSTAEFPYSHNDGVRITYQGDCKHEIWAYVDSQNSFGATIRTKYYAVVKNQYGTDKWMLIDIKF